MENKNSTSRQRSRRFGSKLELKTDVWIVTTNYDDSQSSVRIISEFRYYQYRIESMQEFISCYWDGVGRAIFPIFLLQHFARRNLFIVELVNKFKRKTKDRRTPRPIFKHSAGFHRARQLQMIDELKTKQGRAWSAELHKRIIRFPS